MILRGAIVAVVDLTFFVSLPGQKQMLIDSPDLGRHAKRAAPRATVSWPCGAPHAWPSGSPPFPLEATFRWAPFLSRLSTIVLECTGRRENDEKLILEMECRNSSDVYIMF